MCWELYIQHCIYQHLYNMYSVSGISSNPEMTSSLWENVCRLFYRGTWVSLNLGTLRGPGTHPPWTQGNECKAMNEEQLGILNKNRPASAMASNMWLTPMQERKTHATLQEDSHPELVERHNLPLGSCNIVQMSVLLGWSADFKWPWLKSQPALYSLSSQAGSIQPSQASKWNPNPKPQTKQAWSWTRDPVSPIFGQTFFFLVWWISFVGIFLIFILMNLFVGDRKEKMFVTGRRWTSLEEEGKPNLRPARWGWTWSVTGLILQWTALQSLGREGGLGWCPRPWCGSWQPWRPRPNSSHLSARPHVSRLLGASALVVSRATLSTCVHRHSGHQTPAFSTPPPEKSLNISNLNVYTYLFLNYV